MVIDARDAEALEKTAAELEGLGGAVTALAGDVNDPAHRRAEIMRQLVAEAEAALSRAVASSIPAVSCDARAVNWDWWAGGGGAGLAAVS